MDTTTVAVTVAIAAFGVMAFVAVLVAVITAASFSSYDEIPESRDD